MKGEVERRKEKKDKRELRARSSKGKRILRGQQADPVGYLAGDEIDCDLIRLVGKDTSRACRIHDMIDQDPGR